MSSNVPKSSRTGHARPASSPRKPNYLESDAETYLRDYPTMVAIASGLPGGADGPQDAYRHLIFAAEMVRLYGIKGSAVAQLRETGAWAKEIIQEGDYPTSAVSEAGRDMDRHNNRIGFEIGRKAKTFADVVRLAREVMREAIKRGGIGGFDKNGNPRVKWLGTPSLQNLPADWDRKSLPHHYLMSERYREGVNPPPRNYLKELRRSHRADTSGISRHRKSVTRTDSNPSEPRNTRVPAHSPLREGQAFAEMDREQAREAIEDRLLDDAFSARLLRGDPDALDERSALFQIAFPDGQTSEEARGTEGDPDDDLLIDVSEAPFEDMPAEDAKRRIERARRDRRFRERLLSGDRIARRRMVRLFATAFPQPKETRAKVG